MSGCLPQTDMRIRNMTGEEVLLKKHTTAQVASVANGRAGVLKGTWEGDSGSFVAVFKDGRIWEYRDPVPWAYGKSMQRYVDTKEYIPLLLPQFGSITVYLLIDKSGKLYAIPPRERIHDISAVLQPEGFPAVPLQKPPGTMQWQESDRAPSPFFRLAPQDSTEAIVLSVTFLCLIKAVLLVQRWSPKVIALLYCIGAIALVAYLLTQVSDWSLFDSNYVFNALIIPIIVLGVPTVRLVKRCFYASPWSVCPITRAIWGAVLEVVVLFPVWWLLCSAMSSAMGWVQT